MQGLLQTYVTKYVTQDTDLGWFCFKFGLFQEMVQSGAFLGQGPKRTLPLSSSQARHRIRPMAVGRAPKPNQSISSLLLVAIISLWAGLIIPWEYQWGLVDLSNYGRKNINSRSHNHL